MFCVQKLVAAKIVTEPKSFALTGRLENNFFYGFYQCSAPNGAVDRAKMHR